MLTRRDFVKQAGFGGVALLGMNAPPQTTAQKISSARLTLPGAPEIPA
ncbi:twin-arginine translocation signal domain-containing protein, partial [bacterium]